MAVRLLDPVERSSQVLVGLIMALTFTGLVVALAGMVLAALTMALGG